MCDSKNKEIIELRKKGLSLKEIATMLNVPIGTVKSYCSRNQIISAKEMYGSVCLNCGKELINVPHHKNKKFCSDKCRLSWWGKNRDKLHIKNKIREICPICNKEFYRPTYKIKKYCCRECYNKSRGISNG